MSSGKDIEFFVCMKTALQFRIYFLVTDDPNDKTLCQPKGPA